MKLYNFFGIISLFPLWAFRSNLENFYILLTIIVFFLIPYFIHLKILNAHKKNFNFFFSFWFSLLFVYAVDQNIGLWTTSLKIVEIVKIQNISFYIHGTCCNQSFNYRCVEIIKYIFLKQSFA